MVCYIGYSCRETCFPGKRLTDCPIHPSEGTKRNIIVRIAASNRRPVTGLVGAISMHSGTLADWSLVLCLAAPHVLYAAVWLHPEQWQSLFRKHSLLAFSQAATFGKGATRAHLASRLFAGLGLIVVIKLSGPVGISAHCAAITYLCYVSQCCNLRQQ